MSTQVMSELRKAEQAEDEGRWPDAVASWKAVVETQREARFLVRYGLALKRTGETTAAEQAFRSAILEDVRCADAYFKLGVLLEQQGRLEESQAVLEAGLVQEEFQAILTVLGSVRQRRGDIVGATRAYARALELDATDDEAHFALGVILKDSDRHLAAHHFRESIRLAPSPHAHRELGHALIVAREYEPAEQELRRAVAMDPQDAWAHSYLGLIMDQTHRLEEAREEYRRAVKSDGSVPLFWCNLADVCAQLGDIDEADHLFRQALAIQTADPRANLKYGLFLKWRGATEKAELYLRRALEQNPAEERARRALVEMKHSDD